MIKGTITFQNERIYKGDLSPIDGNFKGIIELKDGSYYPINFTFSEGSLVDFNEIIDSSVRTMLLWSYNQVFGINADKKPFNKEEISDLFNFDEYKKNGSNDIHIAIQHWIGNYDGDNIGYMPEGSGKLTYGNGDIYDGEFKQGIPDGKGKLTFNKYGEMEGEFKDGMLNGEGKSSYPNRGEYVGEFKNGLPHGRGEIKYYNGKTVKGEFRLGKFVK